MPKGLIGREAEIAASADDVAEFHRRTEFLSDRIAEAVPIEVEHVR